MQREEKMSVSNNKRQEHPAPKCPRCDSSNTKFCYYNNYSLSQPRYFCKACRRYWTHGGTLRNLPVGGGSRKPKRHKTTATASTSASISQITTTTATAPAPTPPLPIAAAAAATAGYLPPFDAIQTSPATTTASAMSLLQGFGDMSNPFSQFYMMNNPNPSSSSNQAWNLFHNLASSNNYAAPSETAARNLSNNSGASGSQWPDRHLSGSFGSPPA